MSGSNKSHAISVSLSLREVASLLFNTTRDSLK
jgi:hypothetical protein